MICEFKDLFMYVYRIIDLCIILQTTCFFIYPLTTYSLVQCQIKSDIAKDWQIRIAILIERTINNTENNYSITLLKSNLPTGTIVLWS